MYISLFWKMLTVECMQSIQAMVAWSFGVKRFPANNFFSFGNKSLSEGPKFAECAGC